MHVGWHENPSLCPCPTGVPYLESYLLARRFSSQQDRPDFAADLPRHRKKWQGAVLDPAGQCVSLPCHTLRHQWSSSQCTASSHILSRNKSSILETYLEVCHRGCRVPLQPCISEEWKTSHSASGSGLCVRTFSRSAENASAVTLV